MKRRSTIDLHMKLLLGASIYLIIASVVGLNNQFTHEAVAKDSTATKPPNLKQGAKAISAPPDHTPQGGSNTKKTAAAPATSGSLVKPNSNPGLSPTGPPASLANSKNSPGGNGGSDDQATFRHNAQDIAAELSGLTPQQIREYPITDLSDKDIKLVMQFLNPAGLTKVLLYIHQQDLITIEHRLTHNDFDEYLNRLSESDRKQVEDRLASTSGNSIN